MRSAPKPLLFSFRPIPRTGRHPLPRPSFAGRPEDRKTGRLEDWKTGRLEDRKTGRLEGPESRFRRLPAHRTGRGPISKPPSALHATGNGRSHGSAPEAPSDRLERSSPQRRSIRPSVQPTSRPAHSSGRHRGSHTCPRTTLPPRQPPRDANTPFRPTAYGTSGSRGPKTGKNGMSDAKREGRKAACSRPGSYGSERRYKCAKCL